MADLRTDYKDDVLNTEVNELRKYQMIQNEDGTVSFVDVTDYLQVGDSFGSADVNAITKKLTEDVLNTKEEIESNTDENKIAGALAVKELSNNIPKPPATDTTISSNFTSGNTYTADEDCWIAAFAITNSATQFAQLTMYDEAIPTYQDKEIAYGINNRTFLVKLYVKKGTTVLINGEGAIGAIQLHKLV